MRTDFDDAAFFQDNQPVRMPKRGQPMRDDDRRPPLDHTHQRFLNLRFRIDVKRRCRFVEDEDTRIVQDRSGDRQTLPLSSGQVAAVFLQPGVITIGQIDDKIVALAVFAARITSSNVAFGFE